jgi:hypothetical protein
MFVRKSKYDALKLDLDMARLEAHTNLQAALRLQSQCNTMQQQILQFHSQVHLAQQPNLQGFDKQDIRRLLQLCHPDKHDGKQMASDMTAKLVKLLEQL